METPTFTFTDLDNRLRFSPLWNLGIKGDGITIAVLDTGINHVSSLVVRIRGQPLTWDRMTTPTNCSSGEPAELLVPPPLRCGENQKFETDAPPGHCSTAALYKLRMIFRASSFREG